MTPLNSCPGIIGSDGANSPCKICRSVPHIPDAITSRITSLGPQIGSGTLSTEIFPIPVIIAAFNYLTAPSARPRTSLSCATQPAITTGSETTIETAARWAKNNPSAVMKLTK